MTDNTPQERREEIVIVLKPCPFCGGSADIAIAGRDARRVDCLNCDASVVANTQERAVAAWNRRALPAVPTSDEGVEPFEPEIQQAREWLTRLLDGVVNANSAAETAAVKAYRSCNR